MKHFLPIAGFFIALSGCFLELILAHSEDELTATSAIRVIQTHGYPAESHLIETEDGYFLQLHRIPHGKNSTSSKKTLLLLHGLLASSDIYMMMGPDSLPFVAADRGYDVWMVNFRGNHYAKLHRIYSPTSPEFWDHSFHEVGLYDLPAQIDYICNYTQRSKISIIGHSFGTTVPLIMATMRPDYQQKVEAAVLLAAPSIFLHDKHHFLLLSPLYPLTYSKGFTNTEVFGGSTTGRILAGLLGLSDELHKRTFEKLHLPFQKTSIQEFTEAIIYFLRSYPTSGSMKIFAHYFQIAVTGKFRQYDYGPTENLRRYKSLEPPEYNLESITIPMGLMYAPKDSVAGKPDEVYLLKRMKNIKSSVEIKAPLFPHLNFMIGMKNKERIYDRALNILENL